MDPIDDVGNVAVHGFEALHLSAPTLLHLVDAIVVTFIRSVSAKRWHRVPPDKTASTHRRNEDRIALIANFCTESIQVSDRLFTFDKAHTQDCELQDLSL